MISVETIFKRLYYLDKKVLCKNIYFNLFSMLKQYQHFISDTILTRK